MIDIDDKSLQPSLTELCEYVDNPLFDELCEHMKNGYNALFRIEYSGEKGLSGWNLKFKKAGRTLCTTYPRKGHFCVLLVVGQKEKERTERLLPELSDSFREKYNNTQDFMGQRWMVFDFSSRTDVYDDILRIVKIRRESK